MLLIILQDSPLTPTKNYLAPTVSSAEAEKRSHSQTHGHTHSGPSTTVPTPLPPLSPATFF